MKVFEFSIVKIFRVAAERFRLNSEIYEEIILRVCGLLEFRLKNRERWLSEELEPPPRERMRVKNKTYPLPQ
jgi:hypothetical protein